MDELEKDIIDVIKKHQCIYIKISNNQNIKKIHNLIINNVMIDGDDLDIQDSELLHYIGFYHKINKNYDEAIKFYNMAIQLKNLYSMNNLAHMYTNGDGIDKNIDEAIRIYKIGVENGNVTAMVRLGNIYCDENYINKNIDEAIRIYKMAIDLGHITSICHLANIYSDKNSTHTNINEAIRLLKIGVNMENYTAMNNLANIYADVTGINVNYNEAIKLYCKAIKNGNSYAMYGLATMHFYGYGVDKNYDETIILLKMAIKYDHIEAIKSLAIVYLELYKNHDLAVKYYAKYCKHVNEPLNNYIKLEDVDVHWTDYLHKYWPNKKFIGEQIMMLLLMSKNRSKYTLNWMVNGIAKIIIKYLATFEKNMI